MPSRRINGWPQAIHITTANASERNDASALLALNSEQFCLVKRVMAYGGPEKTFRVWFKARLVLKRSTRSKVI